MIDILSNTAITASLFGDIGEGLWKMLAYVAIAVVIQLIGFFLVDLLTPGKLGHLVCIDRNVNATITATTNIVAVGVVNVMAIWATRADFVDGIITTAVFGLVGVLVLALVDQLIDWLTPGSLREMVVGEKFHPASVFLGVAHIVVGILIAASIA